MTEGMIFEEQGKRDSIGAICSPQVCEFLLGEVKPIILNVQKGLKDDGIKIGVDDIHRFLNRVVIRNLLEDISWSDKNHGNNRGKKYLEFYIFKEDWESLFRYYSVNSLTAGGTKLLISRLYHLKQEKTDLSKRVIEAIREVMK